MGGVVALGRGPRGASRRAFIGVSALAGLAAGYFGAPFIDRLGAMPDSPGLTFSLGEAAALETLVEELLPGARAAGVVAFLDRQLAPGAAPAASRGLYRAHLRHLRGRPAAEVEKTYPDFFKTLLTHVKLGYYGNPRYGGNARARVWRDLGFSVCAKRD